MAPAACPWILSAPFSPHREKQTYKLVSASPTPQGLTRSWLGPAVATLWSDLPSTWPRLSHLNAWIPSPWSCLPLVLLESCWWSQLAQAARQELWTPSLPWWTQRQWAPAVTHGPHLSCWHWNTHTHTNTGQSALPQDSSQKWSLVPVMCHTLSGNSPWVIWASRICCGASVFIVS